jgi:hypothetical protein
MTGSVEASRRHGPFDPRWRKRHLHAVSALPASAPAGLEGVPDDLERDAFSRPHLPGRGRRDLVEELSAYAAYQHGQPMAQAQPPRVGRQALSRIGPIR